MATYLVNTDGSITWTGTVTFSGATDALATGVATLTLTPSGGVSSLPALVTGDPGLPPVFRNVTVTEVAAGAALPAPAWTLVSPGGAGVASVYDLTISVHAGAKGDPGTNASISAASDVSGTLADGTVLVYNASTSKWAVSAPKRTIGPYTIASASFTAYSGTAARATLAAMTMPAQPWDWRPRVSGHFYAIGSATTHIDAEVRIGDATTGDLVGYGLGLTSPTAFPISIDPHFGSAVPSSATYGKVAAGATATITLSAVRTTASIDAWQTLADNGQFVVEIVPV